MLLSQLGTTNWPGKKGVAGRKAEETLGMVLPKPGILSSRGLAGGREGGGGGQGAEDQVAPVPGPRGLLGLRGAGEAGSVGAGA